MTKTSDSGAVATQSDAAAPCMRRRKLLVAATGITAGAGIVAASVPFVASMSPSERAKASSSPVDVDLANLEAGQQVITDWRGKPVLVLRRTDAMVKILQSAAHQEKLADAHSKIESQQPDYAQNTLRSRKPEYLVLVSICTHLGCIPAFRPDAGAASLGAEWPGGYYCPCHGSKFDFAGRVYQNVPAPTNLVVPRHFYVNALTIRIGEDSRGIA